ncbi:hypothetical protein FB45DRAFT_1039460 [Roridomyces roridus]|uniref:Uncharacterized protein n=1 Tax=Roridomyces roridus TaxID=1738132 RepID=A0AAD7F8J3_9AGAR|nr:hypothetical protein FB45DRAFT_1039460 [Roridomyces roridus]
MAVSGEKELAEEHGVFGRLSLIDFVDAENLYKTFIIPSSNQRMPTLPPELEREIFELALNSSNSRATCAGNTEYLTLKFALRRVCRRVEYWVDLVSYRSIAVETSTDSGDFLELLARKPPGFFSEKVKDFWIGHFVPNAHAIDLLSACNAVEQLACYVDHKPTPKLPELIRRLPLTRLWIEHVHFSDVASLQSPTFFPALTHLYLIFWERRPPIDVPLLIQKLPLLHNLTHLALACNPTNPRLAQTVCAALPDLLFLVISLDCELEESDKTYAFDPRVVTVYVDYDEEEQDIGDSNRIWVYAEEAVAQRRSKSATSGAS